MATKPDWRVELRAFIKANPELLELGDDEITKAFLQQRVSKDPALLRALLGAIYDELKAHDPVYLGALLAGLRAYKPKLMQ
jgi:hypothetical protein